MSDGAAELTAVEVAARLRDAVAGAFAAFTADAQSQREDLYALTMSGLGGCTRQAAYRLARTPPSEELRFGEMREANIGTMIHLGLLPHLAAQLGGAEEVPVVFSTHELVIKGRTDLYVEPLRTVADLKTVGLSKFGTVGNTVNRAHRLQVGGYASAIVQSGQPVDWIAWIYLDRSGGGDKIIVERFDETLIATVDARLDELTTFAQSPDAAPRDERGPGLSVVCDGCPWLRECWGADAEPGVVGAQRILVHDDEGVEEALRLYDDARARAREADEDKEFARAMFSASQPGSYGEWELRWSNPGETDDKDAAVKLLQEAGIPVPQRMTSRRLMVKRSQT